MKIIGSAAHFTLCVACTLHGRIICADGTGSLEIATKAGGEKEVERLLEEKKITPAEVPGLKRQMRQAFEWIGVQDQYECLDLENLEKTLQGLQKLNADFFEAALNQYHWSVLRIEGAKPKAKVELHPGKPTLH